MRMRLLAVGAALLGFGGAAMPGQSLPTATQALEITAFGAVTGTYTELEGGHNAGITAGADLAFRTVYGFRPAIELRGNTAVDQGTIDGQKSVLIGPRVSKELGRFIPYGDLFYGRGQLDYPRGFIIGNYRYDRTTTNVYAMGAGLDYRVTRHFDVKADVQFERWTTPVVTRVDIPIVALANGAIPNVPYGPIYPIPVSFGVVYHLDFNHYGRGLKREKKRRRGLPSDVPPPAAQTAAQP